MRRLLRQLLLTSDERALLARAEEELRWAHALEDGDASRAPFELTMDVDAQSALLRSLEAHPYATLFARLRSDRRVDASSDAEREQRGDLIQNGYFPLRTPRCTAR